MMRVLFLSLLIQLPAWADPAAAIPPYGWLQYCGQSRDTSCDLGRPLTPEDLAWVQAGIAGQLTPTTDSADRWEAFPPDRVGDCEDYALSFRSALIALGHPPESMALVIGQATIEKSTGSHAVLEVRLDGRSWVLDGIADHIYQPEVRPYEFTEKARQVSGQVQWSAK